MSSRARDIVGRYIRVEDLRPDHDARKPSVAEEIIRFDATAREGRYYVSFNVNSKNFMSKSTGTREFIADFTRLLEKCVAASRKVEAGELRSGFETLFRLYRYIDECNDDIIFFADEGGAWQIPVDWDSVLPAFFACVAGTSDPETYDGIVNAAINDFDPHSRRKHLATARSLASNHDGKLHDVSRPGYRRGT